MRPSLNEAAFRNERTALLEEGKQDGLASRAGALRGSQALTVALFLMYAGPMIIAAELGDDLDVSFWINRLGLAALLLPFVFVATHLVHVANMEIHRYPKWALIAGFLMPAVFLCFIGGYYAGEASYLSVHLAGADCASSSAFPAKAKLQKAYDNAFGVYEECHARLLRENGGLPLPRRPLLQNCREFAEGEAPDADSLAAQKSDASKYYILVGYQVLAPPHKRLDKAKEALVAGSWQGITPARMIVEVRDGTVMSIPYAVGGVTAAHSDTSRMIDSLKLYLKANPEEEAKGPFYVGEDKYLYDYLASLEANYNCAGFCKSGEMLWNPAPDSTPKGEGACAPYVGLKFLTILRQARLLFVIAGITGAVALIGLTAADPLLNRLGYK
eukprot:TRINITY_DN80733_c0_g1_i1.p1 TRINITY_DN80733_c0_g1~~TRINITY_DN80733_c0_g1_i1.p1  ORF type:complete len:386 (+),score=70.15 TRINITY_DN80733_c0_g1_i1:65-1222(+)